MPVFPCRMSSNEAATKVNWLGRSPDAFAPKARIGVETKSNTASNAEDSRLIAERGRT